MQADWSIDVSVVDGPMVAVLFSRGGTFDKYVGDEVIGLFGALVGTPRCPRGGATHPRDAARALSEFNHARSTAGLEMEVLLAPKNLARDITLGRCWPAIPLLPQVNSLAR